MRISRLRDGASIEKIGVEYVLKAPLDKTLLPNSLTKVYLGLVIEPPEGLQPIVIDEEALAADNVLIAGKTLFVDEEDGEAYVRLYNMNVDSRYIHAGDVLCHFMLVQYGAPELEDE